MPKRHDPRMVGQAAGFTFHGNLGRALSPTAVGRQTIARLRLPAHLFDPAKEFLHLSGIDRFSLFPDLEGCLRRFLLKRNRVWSKHFRAHFDSKTRNRTKTTYSFPGPSAHALEAVDRLDDGSPPEGVPGRSAPGTPAVRRLDDVAPHHPEVHMDAVMRLVATHFGLPLRYL